MCNNNPKLANMQPNKSSSTRFAFGGTIGEVLRDHFHRDAQEARLSTKFKLYYRLRPFVPLIIRHRLQREYNQGIDAPDCWYRPSEFVADLRRAIDLEPDTRVIHPWPDGFAMASVLTHDVETAEGAARVDRLAVVEEQNGFRSCWNFVPYKYKIDPGLIADLKARGHEIGVHGYNHDGRLFASASIFKRRLGPINLAIKKFGSAGFRAPMVHRNLNWMQGLDVDYDASCFDIDPFQAMPGGIGGPWPLIVGRFVELPYTLPQDHTLLIALGETSPQVWYEKLAYLRSLSGMAMLITHPDYLDAPSRLSVYRDLLEHLTQQQNVWHALPVDVARWWRLRDGLRIDETRETTGLIGPASERARTMRLSEVLRISTLSPS